MEFRIGDEITLGGDSKYKLLSPITGLTSPDIRNGDGLYAGVDGGYVSSQLYGFRTIVLTGLYVGNSCAEADELRLNLMSRAHIRYLYPIFITTFSGRYYYTEGYISDIKADITGPRTGEFQITLLCPDPLIYDGGDGVDADSAWFEQSFYTPEAGGYIIEYTTPVQWKSGERDANITNYGSAETYPIITIKGQATNPVIYNLTTGKFVALDYTTNAGDELIIDMKNRVITLNGVSIASARTLDSSWWKLVQGINRISFTTDDPQNDVDHGTVKYKIGFEGI